MFSIQIFRKMAEFHCLKLQVSLYIQCRVYESFTFNLFSSNHGGGGVIIMSLSSVKVPKAGPEIEVLVNMVVESALRRSQRSRRVKGRSEDVVSAGIGFRLVPPMGSSGTQILTPGDTTLRQRAGLCIFLSLSHWPWLPPRGSGDMTSQARRTHLAENNSLKKGHPWAISSHHSQHQHDK